MSESLTEKPVVEPASNEPTGEQQQVNTAESQNQEAISTEQSQEAASTDAAKQTNSSATDDDDGLAKFAKSQGIESLSDLSDREKKLLKIASDNQKAYRNNNNSAKITDVNKTLNAPKDDAEDDVKFRSEFNNFRYEQKVNQFWSEEGRDKSIEAAMVDVLNEKKEQFGDEYARNLSNDLDALYGIAERRVGKSNPNVNEQAIRQEERDSINRKLVAGAPEAHAVTQSSNSTKIDSEWVDKVYNPNDPEHVKMLQDAMTAQRSEQY